MKHAELDAEKAEWAASVIAPGALVHGVVGLRNSGPPWLLEISAPAGESATAVLRVGVDAGDLRIERDAQEFARRHGVPVPDVLGSRLDADSPLLLIEAVQGSSAVPEHLPSARLRASGAAAARLSALTAPDHLPVRSRPIEGVDFEALRRESTPHPLLARAERFLAENPPAPEPERFVHGDLWQGNLLWRGDELVAIIDWDCAGRGPAGLDLASLRLDATLLYGLEAADDVLEGWRDAAGREPPNLDHWDAVAGLATPNDLGWFVDAVRGQGRADLERDVLVARRDAFLERALGRLGERAGDQRAGDQRASGAGGGAALTGEGRRRG